MSEGWREKTHKMRRFRARQTRMKNYVRENGQNEEKDAEATKEWLSKNKIVVCPPFGYKADKYDKGDS
jgi:hypothetical protein